MRARSRAAFGGVSTNNSTRDYGYMHKKTSGAIWNMVTGYNGTSDLALAVERNEIDGFCGFDWASLKSQRPNWVKDKLVNILLQDSIEPNDELTKLGVPHVFRYVTNDTNRKVVELILSQQVFHRSFIAPPGTAPAQLAILRKAFDATMKDPQFLAEADHLHRKTTGAKWDMVTGYKGTTDLSIALERGEVEGFCGFDWASLKSQKPTWVRDKVVNILTQDAIEPIEELTKLGVPHIMTFVKDDTTRKVLELILSQTVFHRSFIAPPKTTPANLAILRKAFDATMKDPQFLAEAEKLRIDVAPLSGERVQEVVRNLYASPPEVVDLARAAISP